MVIPLLDSQDLTPMLPGLGNQLSGSFYEPFKIEELCMSLPECHIGFFPYLLCIRCTPSLLIFSFIALIEVLVLFNADFLS